MECIKFLMEYTNRWIRKYKFWHILKIFIDKVGRCGNVWKQQTHLQKLDSFRKYTSDEIISMQTCMLEFQIILRESDTYLKL